MSVTVEINITSQQIADQMVTAFEGGSNYWLLGIRLEKPSADGLSERPWYASPELYDVKDLRIVATAPQVDDDSVTAEYVIDQEQIAVGSRLMAQKSPQHFADLVDESGDATTGDVWLQYVLFGQVVFG